jgi:hypothetical protein
MKRLVFVLLSLVTFGGLIGCSNSTFDDSQKSDRIIMAERSPERCEAIRPECGYGYDYQQNIMVDLWEASSDGSNWLLREEFEDVGVRCEALTESCGWRWFPNTESYIDIWVFDYGSMRHIESPDLPPIPAGLELGDPL